ncbi:unnamed protein product [Caretta caretta]
MTLQESLKPIRVLILVELDEALWMQHQLRLKLKTEEVVSILLSLPLRQQIDVLHSLFCSAFFLLLELVVSPAKRF